jgi:hypothetical protein
MVLGTVSVGVVVEGVTGIVAGVVVVGGLTFVTLG